MVAPRSFDSHMMTMIKYMLTDWKTLDDYERAKQRATARIVRRQSRGNVSAQDGWYMTDDELRLKSKEADKAIARLLDSVA